MDDPQRPIRQIECDSRDDAENKMNYLNCNTVMNQYISIYFRCPSELKFRENEKGANRHRSIKTDIDI